MGKINLLKIQTLLIWLSNTANTSAGIDDEDLTNPPTKMKQNSNISNCN